MLPQWIQEAGLVGAFVLGIGWTLRELWPQLRRRKSEKPQAPLGAKNGMPETAAGFQRTDEWQSWYRSELLKPIRDDLEEIRRELSNLREVLDPSMRTPGGRRKT